MTLNVDLEEVPFAILEAVKARILANRRRLQQGQQQGPKPSLRPRPQRPRIGASSKSWRMPKEAAVVFEDGSRLGRWWWYTDAKRKTQTGTVAYDGSIPALSPLGGFIKPGVTVEQVELLTGVTCTSRIYCGNGSQYVEIAHGAQSSIAIPSGGSAAALAIGDGSGTFAIPCSTNVFVSVFPAGNGTFVLLLIDISSAYSVNASLNPDTNRPFTSGDPYSDPVYGNIIELASYSVAKNDSIFTRALICSDERIRQISVPAKLADLMSYLTPTIPNDDAIIPVGFTAQGATIAARVSLPYRAFGIPGGTMKGLSGISFSSVTPSIFRILVTPNNPIYPSSTAALWSDAFGSVLKPDPESLRWIVEDSSSGAYSPPELEINADLFASTQPFKYGRVIQPGSNFTTERIEYNENEYSIYNRSLYETGDVEDQFMNRSTTQLPESSYEPGTSLRLDLYSSGEVIWDWDDPDYCRRMCLALGFQPADLEP